MRKWIAVWGVALLLPVLAYAQTASTTYTVTYSKSYEYTCPANANLNGETCYCAKGYVVSGKECVEDKPAPAAAAPASSGEVYEDIRIAVAFNDDLTCDKLGIAPADMDMCTKFRAATDKASWKSIPRPPVTAGPVITNPWAPAGQMVMSGTSASTSPQGFPAIATPLPPPPPPPPALPEPAPEPAPLPEDAAAKALAKTEPTKFDDNLDALKNDKEMTPLKDEPKPELPPVPEESTTTEAPPPAEEPSVNMNSLAAGLVPLSLTEEQKIPSGIQMKDPEPVEHVSFFGKIFGWLFGWL